MTFISNRYSKTDNIVHWDTTMLTPKEQNRWLGLFSWYQQNMGRSTGRWQDQSSWQADQRPRIQRARLPWLTPPENGHLQLQGCSSINRTQGNFYICDIICGNRSENENCLNRSAGSAHTFSGGTSHLLVVFLDAIASPSTYPCQWVSQSVIGIFRLEISLSHLRDLRACSIACFIFSYSSIANW